MKDGDQVEGAEIFNGCDQERQDYSGGERNFSDR